MNTYPINFLVPNIVPSLYGEAILNNSRLNLPYVLAESYRRLKFASTWIGARLFAINANERYVDISRENAWIFVFFKNSKIRRVLHHFSDDKQKRRRNRNRIRTVVNYLMSFIILHVNLFKMAVGDYQGKDGFRYFDYNYIVEKTGLKLWMVKRGMKVLQNAGIIRVDNIREEKICISGLKSYKTKEVQIHVSDDLFKAFGLEFEFLKNRKGKMKKFKKEQEKIEEEIKRLERSKPQSMLTKATVAILGSTDVAKGIKNLFHKAARGEIKADPKYLPERYREKSTEEMAVKAAENINDKPVAFDWAKKALDDMKERDRQKMKKQIEEEEEKKNKRIKESGLTPAEYYEKQILESEKRRIADEEYFKKLEEEEKKYASQLADYRLIEDPPS